MTTLDERVAALEARLGAITLATTPPIQIGELTNVPAPGSQLAAQWAQDVSARVVQRFANRAALDAWAAPNGALGVTLDDCALFRRKGGAWSRISPYKATVTGVALAGIAANTFTTAATLTIPADTVTRLVDVSWHIRFDGWPPYYRLARILIDGVNACQWDWQQQPEVAPGDGAPRIYTAALTVPNWPVAINKPIVVTGEVYSSGAQTGNATYNTPQYNRLSISAIGA